MSTLYRVLAVIAGVLLGGCKTTTVLRLANQSASAISVRTSQTGKLYTVGEGERIDIEHTKGAVRVVSGTREHTTYVDVLTPEFRRSQILVPGNFESKMIFPVVVDDRLVIRIGK